LLLFIKFLKVNGIGFVVNSLTKLDCPVLTVLIPLQVLLNFRITYSPPSRRHQGTFRVQNALVKIMNMFLWMGTDTVHAGKCLVAWPYIQRLFELGGLGVLDLKTFNMPYV
jgi:hypothetical protein